MADTRARAGFRASVLAGPRRLAACGPSADPDRELRVAVPYDLSSFDPHAKNSVGAYEVLSAVYEPLVTLDRSMRPVPALAVSWETPDPLTWVFRLRPGVRFHDGSPLTSEDVVASLRRLVTDEPPGDALLPERRRGGHRPGERDTVVVRTLRPNAQLASRLHFALVVPRGSTSESLARRANGTGPFAVAGWQPSSLALQRNPLYWGEAAGASRVRIDFGIPAADAVAAGGAAPYDLVVGARRAEEEARRSGRYRIVEEENIFLRHLAFDVARETTPFCPGMPEPVPQARGARGRQPRPRPRAPRRRRRRRGPAGLPAGAARRLRARPRPAPRRARPRPGARAPGAGGPPPRLRRGAAPSSRLQHGVRDREGAAGRGRHPGAGRVAAQRRVLRRPRRAEAQLLDRGERVPHRRRDRAARDELPLARAAAGWASTTTATTAARTSTGGSSRREASSTCTRARRPCRASSSGSSGTACGSRSTTTAARCSSRGASPTSRGPTATCGWPTSGPTPRRRADQGPADAS